ncbi:unnamed protein product, partial [Nesidiocoris tenuis]
MANFQGGTRTATMGNGNGRVFSAGIPVTRRSNRDADNSPSMVPTMDFIDFTLSKTQRRTPCVVHKHYKISRIRGFYMRKIRFTQQNFHDRLSQIIQEFPKLDRWQGLPSSPEVRRFAVPLQATETSRPRQ